MTEKNEIKVIELGCAGHLIVADKCRWHRHTQIGDSYRVSSIGDYYYDDKRETIGAGADSFFETLVFKTTDISGGNDGCGCHEVADWSEIDGIRSASAGQAQAEHERFVAKYVAVLSGNCQQEKT